MTAAPRQREIRHRRGEPAPPASAVGPPATCAGADGRGERDAAPPAREETPSAPPPDAVTQTLAAPQPSCARSAAARCCRVALARALAFTALAAWGALHWMAMLEPSEPRRAWLAVAVGLLAIAALLGAGRLPAPSASSWPSRR